MIVDTHVHVVAEDRDSYPLAPAGLPGRWYLESPCSAEGLIEQMDAAGVDRAVLVQGVGAYSFDNRYATDSAARHPERFVSAVCVDARAEDAAETLRRQAREHGTQGVRLFTIGQRGFAIDDPATFPLWRVAADEGLHVIVTLLSDQLPALDRVLDKFRETPVSLDHCGFPALAGPPWQQNAKLLELSRHGNLNLKVSTHVLDASAEATGDPGTFVSVLAEHFGANRMMWGSDFCQTHDRSYAELVALGRRAFGALPDAERDQCLGATASRLWPARIPRP
jgi:predicted TIM-barrel fold metal-dependent hydrolase